MPRNKKTSRPDPIPACGVRPRSACILPPSTPYPCNAKLLGRTVPGRHGGEVIACATPSRDGKHPREGQLAMRGPDGQIGILRKSTARRRVHDAGVPMHRPEPLLSRTAAQAALADIGNHVPGPVEPDHLHRAGSPTCCTDHKKWRAFAAVVEDIRERVAIEHQDSTDAEYQHALVDAVLADPLGREMLALESACARRVLERSERRGRHDSLAEHRERQRDHLGEAAGRGEYTSSLDDLQSAVDELSGSTRAKKARKAGNVSLARKLEQQARDAKSTKRKSVRTHRAG